MTNHDIKLTILPQTREMFPDFAAFGMHASWPADAVFDATDIVGRPAEPPFELNSLAEHPRIAVWRSAYRAMGLKPSAIRSSVEQLVRRDLSKGLPVTGIAAVDLYNRVSRAYAVPLGGYDVARIEDAPIEIRALDQGLSFEPWGGGIDKMPMKGTVIGYCQEDRCLCYALNHRDDSRTAICAATTAAYFVSEALDAEGTEASQEALRTLSEAIRKVGGTTSSVVKATDAPAVGQR